MLRSEAVLRRQLLWPDEFAFGGFFEIASLDEQAAAVEQGDRAGQLPGGHARGGHQLAKLAGDPHAGGARAEHNDALFGQRVAFVRTADNTPATATAAVPWMSSLKLGRTSR